MTNSNSGSGKTFLPAAGRDWALPLYDPVVRWLGLGPTRERLVDQAAISPGHRILEIGCGTGDVLLAAARRHPHAELVGLDPDPKALDRARRKIARVTARIQLDRGFSDAMPYSDQSFDRVLSSFMFHHLPADAKAKTLREVYRVLRPDGSLHLLDFAGTGGGGRAFLIRIFHSDQELADNAEDRVIARMREAGFRQAERVERQALFFGHVRLNYYRAQR